MSRNVPFGLKRIFFDRIFERSFWTWRKHPAIIVPAMLQAALSLILQSVVTLAMILLITSDPANPQLGRLLAAMVIPTSGLLGVVMNPAFWLTNIPLAAAVVVSLVLVALMGGGWVYSSEYGMYLEAWNNENIPVSSVLSNGSRRWRSMAWTLLLSNLITWGPACPCIARERVRSDAHGAVRHGDPELRPYTDASLDKVDDLPPRGTVGCGNAVPDLKPCLE